MKNIFLAVYTLFQERKNANEKAVEDRIQYLREKYPAYSEIDDKIHENRMKLLSIIGNPAKRNLVEELRTEYFTLKEDKKRFFVDARIPKDYDELTPLCSLCNDEGFTYNEHHLREKCSCFIREEMKLKTALSGLQNILNQENFDTFDITLFDDTPFENATLSPRTLMESHRQGILEYIRDFDDTLDNLLFCGKPGVGKSFLSHALAKELLAQNRSVIYVTSIDLFEYLRNDYYDDEESVYTAKDFSSVDFLIIDDLGAESVTDFVLQELFHLINKRILNQKKFLINTNLDDISLRERYSERIASRILGTSQLYYFEGDDLRYLKRRRKNV